MSIKIMSAVFESETLGPTERLIMLALADHADDEGRCYPSTSRLCQRTGLKDRAVQSNLKRLQSQGYITIVPNGGPKGVNLFFVRATPAADAPPHLITSTPAANADEPSGTVIGGGGSAGARELLPPNTDPTWREQMLNAMGVDPSGLSGPSGKVIGQRADLDLAGRWEVELGLSREAILIVIRETMQAKRDGPPSTFRYFTKAMEREAARRAEPPLQPASPNEVNHDRPAASNRRQAAADDALRRRLHAAARID